MSTIVVEMLELAARAGDAGFITDYRSGKVRYSVFGVQYSVSPYRLPITDYLYFKTPYGLRSSRFGLQAFYTNTQHSALNRLQASGYRLLAPYQLPVTDYRIPLSLYALRSTLTSHMSHLFAPCPAPDPPAGPAPQPPKGHSRQAKRG
jgi:hypothetical protein